MYQQCDGTWSNGISLEICLDPFFEWMNAHPEALLGLVVLLGALMVLIWAMGGLDQTEEQLQKSESDDLQGMS